MEVLETLFGELPVTPQRRIVLLRDVNINQPSRASHRCSQGRKRARNSRQGISYKKFFASGIN